MSAREPSNVAASVRQRLLNHARATGRAFQEVATLYAMERFLYRLGISEHVDTFVLKGGLMTLTWAGEFGRITRDIDLLGRGDPSVDAVIERIGEVLKVEAHDGMLFQVDSLEGQKITVQTAYVGARLAFSADLAGMVIRMQVDVGFGDAVVPRATMFEYPQLLDLGAPMVWGYPAEATLAEKLHAIVHLGFTNSRMKDYYDLWTAHRVGIVTAVGLAESIRHTFQRRDTAVPAQLPEGLTGAFAQDPSKNAQWAGFMRKSRLEEPTLAEAVEAAAELAIEAFRVAREG